MMRILHVNIDNKNCGGAYFLVKNIENYIDDDIIFDFFTMDEFVDNDNKKLNPKKQSKTYSAHLRDNRLLGHIILPFVFYKTVKTSDCPIVHIHTDSTWKALLYAIPMKIQKRKVLIHSHAMDVTGNCEALKLFLHKRLKEILKKFTDFNISCSDEAHDWMFGDSVNRNILFNGIDIDNYIFSNEKRADVRKKWNISNDEIVVGNVGMISKLKNQSFVIDILKQLDFIGIRSKAVFVGSDSSNMKSFLLNKTKTMNLEDRIIFNGFSNDISYELSGMDIFLLPSLNEGFSLALLEAQANGLYCISSKRVPLESKVTDYVYRIAIEDPKEWADTIDRILKEDNLAERKKRRINEKYSIRQTAKELERIYRRIISET